MSPRGEPRRPPPGRPPSPRRCRGAGARPCGRRAAPARPRCTPWRSSGRGIAALEGRIYDDRRGPGAVLTAAGVGVAGAAGARAPLPRRGRLRGDVRPRPARRRLDPSATPSPPATSSPPGDRLTAPRRPATRPASTRRRSPGRSSSRSPRTRPTPSSPRPCGPRRPGRSAPSSTGPPTPSTRWSATATPATGASGRPRPASTTSWPGARPVPPPCSWPRPARDGRPRCGARSAPTPVAIRPRTPAWPRPPSPRHWACASAAGRTATATWSRSGPRSATAAPRPVADIAAAVALSRDVTWVLAALLAGAGATALLTARGGGRPPTWTSDRPVNDHRGPPPRSPRPATTAATGPGWPPPSGCGPTTSSTCPPASTPCAPDVAALAAPHLGALGRYPDVERRRGDAGRRPRPADRPPRAHRRWGAGHRPRGRPPGRGASRRARVLPLPPPPAAPRPRRPPLAVRPPQPVGRCWPGPTTRPGCGTRRSCPWRPACGRGAARDGRSDRSPRRSPARACGSATPLAPDAAAADALRGARPAWAVGSLSCAVLPDLLAAADPAGVDRGAWPRGEPSWSPCCGPTAGDPLAADAPWVLVPRAAGLRDALARHAVVVRELRLVRPAPTTSASRCPTPPGSTASTPPSPPLLAGPAWAMGRERHDAAAGAGPSWRAVAGPSRPTALDQVTMTPTTFPRTSATALPFDAVLFAMNALVDPVAPAPDATPRAVPGVRRLALALARSGLAPARAGGPPPVPGRPLAPPGRLGRPPRGGRARPRHPRRRRRRRHVAGVTRGRTLVVTRLPRDGRRPVRRGASGRGAARRRRGPRRVPVAGRPQVGRSPPPRCWSARWRTRPADAAAARQLRLTKPPGSLGRLEHIGARLAAIAGECPPPLPRPAATAVFAGDHGVHAQGVSPWPQEVTAQMVANFLAGGAAVNVLAAPGRRRRRRGRRRRGRRRPRARPTTSPRHRPDRRRHAARAAAAPHGPPRHQRPRHRAGHDHRRGPPRPRRRAPRSPACSSTAGPAACSPATWASPTPRRRPR